MILTHGIPKMAAADEHDMNIMLSQQIFLPLLTYLLTFAGRQPGLKENPQAQSHANSFAGAYSQGYAALI